jgi:hypothetical protein
VAIQLHVESHQGPSERRCPFCHGAIEPRSTTLWECPGCETPHHRDCARENKGCTTLGCRRAFEGQGVIAPPRPGRRLQPVGAPRTDFIVGVVLTILAAAGLTGTFAIMRLEEAICALQATAPALAAGIMTIGYALRRARRENRWSS